MLLNASRTAVNHEERVDAYSWSMPWVRKFAEPIALKDGRTLATLADAHALMMALPDRRQRDPHWQYAGELLQKAASRDGGFALAQAHAQLPRALKSEGLL
jgi:hypothetical protein